jgi:hypothetical protein
VAAYLNALEVLYYPYTVDEVIDMVATGGTAKATLLEDANKLGCPLP